MAASVKRPARRAKPQLELLEDRLAPATLVVNIPGEDNNPNNLNLSLREAVAIANTNNQADSILFAPAVKNVKVANGRIILTETGVGRTTSIEGGGNHTVIEREAAISFGVFGVAEGVFANFRNLTVANGQTFGEDGGAFLLGGGNGANVKMENLNIVNNRAVVDPAGFFGPTGGFGGAIAQDAGSLEITNSTIANNISSRDGGGLSLNSGLTIINGVTISGNTATTNTGGGLKATFNHQTRIYNTTVSGNEADDDGGGLAGDNDARFYILFSTITANRANANVVAPPAAAGGGLNLVNIVGNATALLNNTVVSGNFRGTNNVADDVNGPLLPGGVNNFIGGNAQLGPLEDNGGRTQTHAPLPGSPLLNAGNTALAVGLGADQRGVGFPRVVGVADIGAVEGTRKGEKLIVGADAGSVPNVRLFNSFDTSLAASFFAFAPGFTGGVRVASGDFNFDGVLDAVVASGPGGNAHIKIINGNFLNALDATGQISEGVLLASFFAFPGYQGGTYVATGDITGDGRVDVIVGAGAGSPGGHVKVFNGATGAEVRSFFAFPGYTGGVTVASGDVTGDGRDDIIVGAGPGAPGGHVKVFNGATGAEFRSFFAFEGFTGGVFVASGRSNNDNRAEIIVGAGNGGNGHVKVFNGLNNAVLNSFLAYPGFTGAARVSSFDVNDDGLFDIVTGVGPGAPPHVKAFNATNGALLRSFFAFDAGFLGGVYV